MIPYCAIPKNISMFAVSSANSISITRSDIFCIPTLRSSHIGCPSSMNYRTRCDDLSLPTRGLGSLFFCPHITDSIMANSLNPAQREKQSTPLHTCSSYENARLRLAHLRQSIISWMETTIRAEFPEATKTRSRIRKMPHGRVRYYASVRSNGIFLSFSTYSLTAFSAAVSRAGAKHRIHHTAHYE